MGLRDRWREALPCLLLLFFAIATIVLRLWPERERVADIARRAFYRLFPCLNRSLEKDPFEQRVREKCQQRRIERSRFMLIVACVMIVAQMAANFMSILRDEPVFTVPTLYGQSGLAVVMGLMPRLLTRKTIDVIYCLAMLMMVIDAAVLSSRPFFLEYWRMSMLWGLFNTRLWLNAIWMILLAATASSRTFASGGPDMSEYARSSLGTFVGVFLVLAALDASFEKLVRHELSALDSRSQLSAVRTLLNSICDVMVELDNGLRMVQHSPKLADILLQGPLRSLAGATLQEFMPEEADRESFAQQMRVSAEAAEHASVFHTKLRDGVGGSVAMELFSVVFKGVDGRRRHILGMREFTDVQPLTEPVQRERRPPLPPQAHVRRNWPGTPQSSEWSDIASHNSQGSDAASHASEPEGAEAPPGLDVASHASEPEGAEAPLGLEMIETADLAKHVTLARLLCSWNTTALEGWCCPMHAVVAETQRRLDAYATAMCEEDFGQERTWQCKRCGIADDRFKLGRSATRCKFCRDIAMDLLRPRRAEPAHTSGQVSL